MTATPVVTAFLRNRGEVLLLHRSPEVGSYPGLWGAVSGHADGDPDTAVRSEIAEETGLESTAVSLVRRGDPFEFADEAYSWRVHPYLFDCDNRSISTNWETTEAVWVSPTEILDRETVPELWTSYDRVRPTIDSIVTDDTHGSAYLSRRALEVLRDTAAVVRREHTIDDELYSPDLEEVASDLIASRPAMTAVANRIHRVMTAAETPESIEKMAHEGIDQAIQDARDVAATASGLLGDRVATLSRSGTVSKTLELANPDMVLVSESRPGQEGIQVAESFAADTEVVLTTDAAFAGALEHHDIETLIVGADTVLPDGRVVNKVGTRSAAIAASHEDIQTLVLASTAKITPELHHTTAETHLGDLYAGDAPLTIWNPTFETTPPSLIDAIVTEDGAVNTAGIEKIAADHRQRRTWLEDT